MKQSITVASKSFTNGGWIPDRHSAYGENISPELILEGIDPSAVSIAITLDDIDHPLFPGYNHWVAWNLPVLDVIPEGLPCGGVVERPFHMEQGIVYGKHCYKGPKPPFNWCHEYRFTVYILDVKLRISPDSDKKALLDTMEGHVIQTGVMTGRYQRKRKDCGGGNKK